MIKAVIFDLDGVLVTTDELHFAAWKALAEELGITGFTKADNARQRGVSRMASLEVVLEKTDRKFSDEEKTALAEKKNDMYVKSLSGLSRADVLPGVFEFIEYIKSKGIKAAVGSASKNTPLILEKTELGDKFDAVSCGLDTTRSKPDPEVFLIAANKLGTEMFMIDYYIHTEPQIAKTLLQYRIDTLDGARKKAKEYGLKGAYYAWESQDGGYEGCSDYNVTDVFTKRPMRTHFRDKQYHVSAAIVYGLMKYIKGTGDYDILNEGAMDMVIECAEFYRSLLIKKADEPYYEIHDVVGPDEYHERVNNNAYTNRMAKFVFDTALELIEKYPYDKYDGLKPTLKDSSENIFICKPDGNGIIEQFDGYFKLEDVRVDEVRSRLIDPKEYWGGAYGVAADTQVIKQADVVAMLSMFKDDYTSEIMEKNLKYYELRTEHGSSLSACMYSLLSCYTNNPEVAYPMFMKSAKADLVKGGKEWAGLVYIGGTHPAAAGGAWIVAVKGFAGITEEDGKLICKPNLPEKWHGMSFKLMYQNKLYEVNITGENVTITAV